jgi:hypothetical protein
VFGHLYAGRTSFTFYRDWRRGHRLFTQAIRDAYTRGLTYTASFDLTAFYDSIDHAVLKHFLRRLAVAEEVCSRLCELLAHWSAASDSAPIYQGHGIPQGPLTSGLIAECVLQRIDRITISRHERYLRYVDDIRLFAKTEDALLRRLVSLDLASKEVGLFPQSGKVDIHRIKNINDEVKTVSNPPEPGTPGHPADQDRVHRRLFELSRRHRVSDETRFKFVLGQAMPRARQTYRLLRIMDRTPHLYLAICNYLARADRLSPSASRECLAVMKNRDLYTGLTSGIVRILQRCIHPRYAGQLATECRKQLKRGNGELQAAAGSALLSLGGMTWPQTRYQVLSSRSWFVRGWLAPFVDRERIGDPSYGWLLNQLIRDRSQDVALVGVELLLDSDLEVRRPIAGIHRAAQRVLKDAGLIGRVAAGDHVGEVMVEVLGPRVAGVKWRTVLGGRYVGALRKISRWQAYARTDPSAWVALTDTINDLLLEQLFLNRAGSIGSYAVGTIGSVLSPTSRFARAYPDFFEAVRTVHRLRLESDLSHAFLRATGRATRRIEYREVPPVKRKLVAGYVEVWRQW